MLQTCVVTQQLLRTSLAAGETGSSGRMWKRARHAPCQSWLEPVRRGSPSFFAARDCSQAVRAVQQARCFSHSLSRPRPHPVGEGAKVYQKNRVVASRPGMSVGVIFGAFWQSRSPKIPNNLLIASINQSSGPFVISYPRSREPPLEPAGMWQLLVQATSTYLRETKLHKLRIRQMGLTLHKGAITISIIVIINSICNLPAVRTSLLSTAS